MAALLGLLTKRCLQPRSYKVELRRSALALASAYSGDVVERASVAYLASESLMDAATARPALALSALRTITRWCAPRAASQPLRRLPRCATVIPTSPGGRRYAQRVMARYVRQLLQDHDAFEVCVCTVTPSRCILRSLRE